MPATACILLPVTSGLRFLALLPLSCFTGSFRLPPIRLGYLYYTGNLAATLAALANPFICCNLAISDLKPPLI
jgi:histidinol-phosphate/aromatic aminotransferase/cobyric acid decarboxylase-like protein